MGIKTKLLLLAGLFVGSHLLAEDALPENLLSADAQKNSIWVDGIGSGYVKKARLLDLSFTRGFGSTNYGGDITHDLLMGRFTFSQSINDVWAPNKWYGGNLFFTGEIMGGVQDRPDSAYLIFGNAGLRYDFATKVRLIPFVSASCGAGATAIGAPDLSEGIQFASQVGIGARYHFSERVSATFGVGYMHVSNGGYKKPNGGINSYMITVGLGWAL